MNEYAWWCPVCVEVRHSETCPKCPDVLLLRVKATLHPKSERYYWRQLS